MTLIDRGKYWHYAFQMDGRRYRGSTKESVKARAAQFEQALMGRIREGGDQAAPKKPITLAAWAKLFLGHCESLVLAGKLDLDTELYYKNGWRLLEALPIAQLRLTAITSEDANILTFPGGPSNTNCALRTLRRLLNTAVDRGRLLKAPKIHLVEERGRQQLVEPWMEELLLRHARQPLHNILIDIFDSGRRPEEVMRTRRSDLLWDHDRVNVAKHKTSKRSGGRTVPLTDRMKRIYADHKGKEDNWLYPSKRAECGHRTTISKQWRACVARVNREQIEKELPRLPEDLVPYCGRHTFATDLMKASKNIRLVQKTLGHADIRTTVKYLHPDESEAVELINARNRRATMRVVEKTG